VERKKKAKSGLVEGWKTIIGNPRIRNLALLVVGYGVSHRLFEFAWKGQLRVLFPSPLEYQVSPTHCSVTLRARWVTLRAR
jgi:AAA family ATP:ADP antiporter